MLCALIVLVLTTKLLSCAIKEVLNTYSSYMLEYQYKNILSVDYYNHCSSN